MADQKLPAGQTPSNTGAEPGRETFNNLGSTDSGEILDTVLSVMKTAGEQAHEDLKSMAGHVKGDSSEGALDDLHLQDSGEGGLDAINLQEIDQHQSSPLQLLSNLVKQINVTSGSIISKLGDAVGGSSGGKKKKTWLSLLPGLLLLGIAVFVGVRFFVPWMMQPGTTSSEPGPPEIASRNPGPPDEPVQYPPNPCDLKFENPLGPEGIPLQGALDVMWSRVPGAASYEFQVIPPEGAGEPWIMPTDGTSRKIYMENFPAGGGHKFALSALDGNGTALCSIEMAFDKPATGDEARQTRDPEAAGPGECTSMMACPP